jgi:hypothetical protein
MEYNKTKEFWESKFSSKEPIWHFHPSDSAIEALRIFKANNIGKILIPGIGYGRNAKLFLDNGLKVTGIEIADSAISIAASNGINCRIHHGSVMSMPFDDEIYEGIYCYALIHLLNKVERKKFLEACFNQLRKNGLMIFVVISINDNLFGTGKYLSQDRFEVSKYLKVFFYDKKSIIKEYNPFGLVEYKEIYEPVKFRSDQPPIKMYWIICKK